MFSTWPTEVAFINKSKWGRKVSKSLREYKDKSYLLESFILIGLLLKIRILCFLSKSLKRKAKIKDTGKILPGHGGILDRLDGVIFALPLGFFIFKVLWVKI